MHACAVFIITFIPSKIPINGQRQRHRKRKRKDEWYKANDDEDDDKLDNNGRQHPQHIAEAEAQAIITTQMY